MNLDPTIVIDLGGVCRLDMEREIADDRLRRLLEGNTTTHIGSGGPVLSVLDLIRRRLVPRRAERA